MSFIKYCNHTGVKMVLFYPLKNAYKIDCQHVSEHVTLVQVDASEAELKKILAQFSQASGIPILPSLDHQYDANRLRGYFLEEHFRKTGEQFDYYVQSLSSAFGPIGMYKAFGELI